MKYQKFEQHISESLRNDTMDLDIDALIQDIHNQKPKRRFVGLWWIGISTLLISGGLWYILSTPFKDHKEPQIKNSFVKNNDQPIQDLKLVNNELADNDHISNSSESNDITENTSKHYEVTNRNSSKAFAGKITNTDTKSNVIEEEGFPNNLNTQSQSEIPFKEKSETLLNIANPLESFPVLENLSLSPIIFKNNTGINPRKVICPDFSSKTKFEIAISPEVGIFLPIKSLVNKGTEFENVFNMRSQNEKSLEGIYAGVFAQISSAKWPVYLKTGFTWSRFTEKMNLEYSYTEKDTTQGIISITYSQTGDTITAIIGDIITERRLSGSKIRHHQFQLWDIPLGIGYEQSFGRWYTSLEAGMNINLSSQSSGTILQTDTSFVDVNLPIEHFRKRLGISYFAGVQIGRWIHNDGKIYLSTRFRMFPDTFSVDTNNAVQKYHFLGLNLGYSHLF